MSHHNVKLAATAPILVFGLLLSGCGRRDAGGTTTVATTAPSTTASVATTTTSVAASTTTSVTTTTVDVATTKAQITTNWERFFQPTTSIDDRVALLQNGESLRQALVLRAADPLMKQASAKVTAVELTGSDSAAVTYDVFLNGAPALTASQGTAILQDGVWKVAADSFCALISLGATEPLPGCG